MFSLKQSSCSVSGSGTTGHAVVELNREDGGRRKFILVEIGDYFNSVLVPRMQKIMYSPKWLGGKPVRTATKAEIDRGPRILKCLAIESFEDALNNILFTRTDPQQELLAKHPALQEDYSLQYMLDIESEGSASLLSTTQFENPFNYTMKISTGSAGETRETKIDLVETFNWLLGLKVKHVDWIRGFAIVEGVNPGGQKVLVIWRNVREKSSLDLDEFFQKQGYNTKDNEFDLVYVNGDNNLENLRRDDETWKVRLIEEEFKRVMFDVEEM